MPWCRRSLTLSFSPAPSRGRRCRSLAASEMAPAPRMPSVLLLLLPILSSARAQVNPGNSVAQPGRTGRPTGQAGGGGVGVTAGAEGNPRPTGEKHGETY